MGVFIVYQDDEAVVVMVPEGGFYRTVRMMQKRGPHHKLLCDEKCSACHSQKADGGCGKLYELQYLYDKVVREGPNWMIIEHESVEPRSEAAAH